MARKTLSAYGEPVADKPDGLTMAAYLEALAASDLSTRRWVDARHEGVIDVRRDDDGVVRVFAPAAASSEGGS